MIRTKNRQMNICRKAISESTGFVKKAIGGIQKSIIAPMDQGVHIVQAYDLLWVKTI